MSEIIDLLVPEKIIRSGPATIVFWKNGDKTIVKLQEGVPDDAYTAFTAAFAKYVYGSNSYLKRMIKDRTKVVEPKQMKADPPKAEKLKAEEPKAEEPEEKPGRKPSPKTTKAIPNDVKLKIILERAKRQTPIRELSEKYGVGKSTIYRILATASNSIKHQYAMKSNLDGTYKTEE